MGVDAVGDGEFWLGDVFQQRLMFGFKGGYLPRIKGGTYAAGCTDARNRRVACCRRESLQDLATSVESAPLWRGSFCQFPN